MKITKGVTIFLIFFVVAFPKGGVKASGIPITWGYLGLELLSLVVIPLSISRFLKYRRFTFTSVYCFITFFVYQLVLFIMLFFNGFHEMGFAASLILNYVFLPWVLVFGCSYYISGLDFFWVSKLLNKVVIFVAIYGVFLFFYKIMVGSFLEIPYLTVNAGDVGELSQKHIDRGGLFKLISTYNNGNIYGVTLLMLLPVFCKYESSTIKRSLVKLSLLLTLSRTVWVGLILYELFYFVVNRKKSISLFGLISFFVFLLCSIISFVYIIDLLGWDSDFLFDPSLGGRLGGESYPVSLISYEQFKAISEMTFKSFVEEFGVLPTLLVYQGLTAPLFCYLFSKRLYEPWKRELVLGIVLYLIVSQSDGASLFIPVMAVYWGVNAFILADYHQVKLIKGKVTK